jgi:hypothetical protein
MVPEDGVCPPRAIINHQILGSLFSDKPMFFFFSGDDIHSSAISGFTRVPWFSIYTIGMSHFTWLAWWTKIDKHWTCCKRDPNLETWTTKNRVELPSLVLFCELNKTDIAWYSDDFTWHLFHGLWKRILGEMTIGLHLDHLDIRDPKGEFPTKGWSFCRSPVDSPTHQMIQVNTSHLWNCLWPSSV